KRQFSAADAEWVVMGAAMMGFLNKFMDAMGVELEPEAVADAADLIGPTGWSVGQHGWADENLGNSDGADGDSADGDSGDTADGDNGDDELPPTDTIGSLLRVFRNAPGAVRLDRRWTDGMPKGADKAHRLIAETYGYDEPVLMAMAHAKPRRALTAMLRHNLDPDQSVVGVGVKALAGLVFANHAANEPLADRARALATHHGISEEAIAAADGLDVAPASVESLDALDRLDDATKATLALAQAISPSPAAVDQSVIDGALAAISSAQIVEIVVWVSVCQLIHRLSVYYQLAG
ncbi:MAG: hypothetical protein GY773_15205, partial [Actinomycetia bacterium]|nr:hypothetical protein [Actinomycetes bacterium]